MKKAIYLLLAVWVATLLSGCTITPGIGMGIDFDYSGGEFHARPNMSIGLTGHP